MFLKGPENCFVVGFPRSGTTMLAAILDRHSRIAATPETMFYERLYKKVQRLISGSSQRREIVDFCCQDSRFSDLNLDPALLEARIGKLSAPEDVLGEALSMYAEKKGGSLVVEKSPAHLLHLEKLSNDFPAAKFIAIVRDGRASIASLLDVPWAHNSIARHAAEWVRRMTLLRAMHRRLGERLYVCRYEELVQSPEAEVAAVCNFLGLEFESQMLDGGRTDSSVVPQWESNWKQKANRNVDVESLQRWRNVLSSTQIALATYIMRSELKTWGYPVDFKNPTLTERIVANVMYGNNTYPVYAGLRSAASRILSHG